MDRSDARDLLARCFAAALAAVDPEEAVAARLGGVVAAGHEPEPRAFRPHLTLGRVRGRYALPPEPPPLPEAPFDVAEAVLFRSQLGRGGSRYTPLERPALGGSNHPTT